MQNPSVGRIVHYVSYGTPGGEYSSQCRAAVVTEVADPEQPRLISLAVLNPEGMFFNRDVKYDDGEGAPGDPDCPVDHQASPFRYCEVCEWTEPHKVGGTWHWPERTES
jgi:hypothetical protein